MNAGKTFEQHIEAKLAVIAQSDPAFWWFRIPDGLKPIWNRKTKSIAGMRPDITTPADYCYSHNGKIGIIEAKSTMQARLPIGKNGIKLHQLESLVWLWQGRKNVKTWLLWQCLKSGSEGVWLISGRALAEFPCYEAKSIPLGFAEACGRCLGAPVYWQFGDELKI